jgi:hypothetical protein
MMAGKRGSTIGSNPLDAVIPQKQATTTPELPASAAPKRAMTVRLDQGLIEKLQAAVYWTPGETITSVMERGALNEIKAMEGKNGGAFQPAAGKVQTGRRPGGG